MPQRARTHTPYKARPRLTGHNLHYGTQRWQRLRLTILWAHPLCEECERMPSSHVDHVKSLADGGTDDPSNLRALCHGCHSRKTCTDDNGWGNKRKT